MSKKNKQKWIEALRSGKYKQSKKALRNDDGFCCLGVACDLMDSEWKYQDDEGEYYFDSENNVLPESVKAWIGTEFRNPRIYPNKNDISRIKGELSSRTTGGNRLINHLDEMGSITLAELNDNGFSFEFIAEMIEKYL